MCECSFVDLDISWLKAYDPFYFEKKKIPPFSVRELNMFLSEAIITNLTFS